MPFYYIPRFNVVERGYTCFIWSVRPSVCTSVRQSDPFHISRSYQATSEGVARVKVIAKFQNLNFWQLFEFKICNFDFVLLWHGIWHESIVWVIMGRRRVFLERRCSSCSNYYISWSASSCYCYNYCYHFKNFIFFKPEILFWWATFCRHFQMQFIDWNFFLFCSIHIGWPFR